MVWSTWLKRLVLPPTGLLILGVLSCAALLFGPGGRVDFWARAGLVVSLGGLWLLSTPLVGFGLLRSMETTPPLDPEDAARRYSGLDDVAIVVLDSGRRAGRESGENRVEDSVRPMTLERLAHGAELHHATGLPVLVSGNGAGALMADVLARQFQVRVRWIEPHSRDTAENALLSAEILREEGFGTVILVTHAWHMPRAAGAFRRAGLEVVPAPTAFTGPGRWQRGAGALVPGVDGLGASYLALHEWSGRLWYRQRDGSAPDPG